MANVTFKDFSSQTNILSGTNLVGYDPTGSYEVRIPVNFDISTSGNNFTVNGSISASNMINVSYKTPFNYLSPANTYTTLFTVPQGYKFVIESLICTIEDVAGTISSGSNPVIAAVNSNAAYNTSFRMLSRSLGIVTPIPDTFARASSDADLGNPGVKTASSGQPVNVMVQSTAGSNTYTVLSGYVIVSGYLY